MFIDKLFEMKKNIIIKNYIISKILIISSVIIKISFSINIEQNKILKSINNTKYNHNSTENLYFVFQQHAHKVDRAHEVDTINNNEDLLDGKLQDSVRSMNIGKERKNNYLIGLNNRLRYNGFIKSKYDSKEIKIYSAKYNNDIISAQMQLLGLYNNISFDKFKNKDIIGEKKLKIKLNEIIPPVNLFEYYYINTTYGKYELFNLDKYKCPLIEEIINKNKQDMINNIINDINNKYIFLKPNDFKLNTNINIYDGIKNFCDSFISNYFDKNNKNINITNILNICNATYKKHFFIFNADNYTKIYRAISTSRIIEKIINLMKNQMNRNTSMGYKSPKFISYNSRSDGLINFQMILYDCFNLSYEYESFHKETSQLIELRKYGSNFYVEIYYNDMLKLNISFNELNNELSKKIMNEEEINEKCYTKKKSLYLYAIIFLIVIFICLLF